MVTVVAKRQAGEILSVRIREVVPRRRSIFQDLVRAAVNEALSRSREMMAAEWRRSRGK
jgi:DNA-binding protein YbaB